MLYIPRVSSSRGLGSRAPFGDAEAWVQIPPRHRDRCRLRHRPRSWLGYSRFGHITPDKFDLAGTPYCPWRATYCHAAIRALRRSEGCRFDSLPVPAEL